MPDMKTIGYLQKCTSNTGDAARFGRISEPCVFQHKLVILQLHLVVPRVDQRIYRLFTARLGQRVELRDRKNLKHEWLLAS